MATTAETIADRLAGDGSCFGDRAPGETFDEICASGGCCRIRPERDRGVVRYAFSDGSAIVLCQNAWDLAIRGSSDACHCLVGTDEGRHAADCVDVR